LLPKLELDRAFLLTEQAPHCGWVLGQWLGKRMAREANPSDSDCATFCKHEAFGVSRSYESYQSGCHSESMKRES
jgi:hypothetical protein